MSQKHTPLIGNLQLKAGYGSINPDSKAYIHLTPLLSKQIKQ